MFVVAVENVEDGDQPQDTIVLVRASWLTPKKQECFWPPCKHSEKFNTTLSRTKDPGEDWSLIKIKRRLYETDDLVKARKKAREAEYKSDLLTDDLLEETSSSVRRSKRKRRHLPYSPEVSDDEDSSNESEKVSDINFPHPPSSSLLDQPPVNNIESSITTHLPSQPVYTPTDGNSPLRNYSDQPPVNNIGSSNTAHLPSQPVYTPTDGNSLLRNYSSGFKVLLRKIENLTEVVEENNKLLHVLLVEKKTAEDSPQIDNNCPFSLPLKTLKDFEDIEDLLKDSEKRKNFVTHLAIIGGVNAEKHVRRILCSVFTNELAQNFNWVGKGDKKALKDTIFPSIIIDAVKRNKKIFAGTTICELEKTIKQWFRFAKDRCGGRDKRRSQNRDNTPRN